MMADKLDEKDVRELEVFNERVEKFFKQIMQWLEEDQIKFTKKEKEISLGELNGEKLISKRFDFSLTERDESFSLVPYSIKVIGANGRVELEGPSGSEGMVYILEGGPEIKKGWHWVDERITGKTPLITKEIFLPLVERIN